LPVFFFSLVLTERDEISTNNPTYMRSNHLRFYLLLLTSSLIHFNLFAHDSYSRSTCVEDEFYDFGDLPTSYDYGIPARQISSPNLFIGSQPDMEIVPAPMAPLGNNNGSFGDGLDEDGINPSLYTVSHLTSLTVTVNVTNTTGSIKTLYGWIDFNGNGSFEPGEMRSINVNSGSNGVNVSLTWTADQTVNTLVDKVYLRLRLSENTLTDNSLTIYDERAIGDGLSTSVYGTAGIGEIEDFQLSALAQPPTRAVQLANLDVFLKGKYVEAGISNYYGTFGADNNANRPAGFHNGRASLYGFIVNQNKDGWISYNGDYFTPGAAEEGFTLEIEGVNYSNNRVGMREIPGAITIVENNTFMDGGLSASRVVWVGSINGIEIQNHYIANQNGLFVKVLAILTNVSSEPKHNIYFMRNIDPDNNQTINGSFETTNKIESQISETSSDARVSATQPDGSYVTFYSNDPRARVSYGGFANRNAKGVYDGVGVVQVVGSQTTADIAISIAYNIGTLNPGESTTVGYFNLLDDVAEPEACYLPALLGAGLDTKVGISSIKRNQDDEDNWPMVRKGAWLVLESPNKAFVPNRVRFDEDNNPVAADGVTPVLTNAVEGMMVYDVDNKCLRVAMLSAEGTIGWYCMNKAACPE
jgi:hypothetical protein